MVTFCGIVNEVGKRIEIGSLAITLLSGVIFYNLIIIVYDKLLHAKLVLKRYRHWLPQVTIKCLKRVKLCQHYRSKQLDVQTIKELSSDEELGNVVDIPITETSIVNRERRQSKNKKSRV